VKLRTEAMLGAISETANMTAAMVNITLNVAEIPFPFGLNIIERTPSIKKRFAMPDSNRLIQLATVKTGGTVNIADAVPLVGTKPVIKSAKVNLIELVNDISGEVDPRVYHEKVITKRSITVAILSVLSNLGFTLEMMKTRVTITKKT
jgi:hypothetical protein